MKECMGEKRGKEDARSRGEGRHGQVHGGKEQGTKEEWNADRERRGEVRRDGSANVYYNFVFSPRTWSGFCHSSQPAAVGGHLTWTHPR